MTPEYYKKLGRNSSLEYYQISDMAYTKTYKLSKEVY